MANFVVVFDVERPLESIPGLMKELNALGENKHLFGTTWLLKPKRINAVLIHTALSKFLASGERVFVASIALWSCDGSINQDVQRFLMRG